MQYIRTTPQHMRHTSSVAEIDDVNVLRRSLRPTAGSNATRGVSLRVWRSRQRSRKACRMRFRCGNLNVSGETSGRAYG